MTRINNEIKHFTNLDHIWWGAKTPAGQKRYDVKYQRFIKYCKPIKNDRILEIGCGDGEFTRRLAVNKSLKIVGSDITPEVIKRAKSKYTKNKNISFEVENAEKFKSKNDKFDIICGVSILHHLNWKKTLKESYRILKDGGKIFFSEPNFINPFIFLSLHSKSLRKKFEFSPDETALVRWEVKRELKKIGFKNIRVDNFDFLHPNTPKKYISRVSKLSNVLEQTPIIKEISGSLIIYAQK